MSGSQQRFKSGEQASRTRAGDEIAIAHGRKRHGGEIKRVISCDWVGWNCRKKVVSGPAEDGAVKNNQNRHGSI